MENQAFQDKLQSWVTGELNPSEVSEFQSAVNRSSELQEEVLFSKKLVQALQNKELLEVNSLISEVIANEALPNQPARGRGWLIFFTAILLIGLVGVGVYISGETNGWFGNRSQQLSKTLITPLENTIFVEDGDYIMETLRLGMAAYDRKDYADAVKKLQAYYDKTKDANGGLYLGITYLLLGEAQKATTLLQSILLQLDGPAREAANWYLALGYLQLNDEQSGIKVLEALSAGDFYKEKADQLLKQLKNN